MSRKSLLLRLQEQQKSFDRKDSRCPICKHPFSDCPHSLIKVDAYFSFNILKERLANG